ncbi:MAG: hypothetical protein HKL87_07230 [Acidimicrobiaceae bacterium]|nr:hypothetical protein [Acidimicrobiaceae bacterium]
MSTPPRPRPPLTTTTSIWPAASIFILGAVMLTAFLLIDAIFNPTTTTTTTIPVVVGGLGVAPSSTLLRTCANPAVTPANIRPGVILPVRTVAVGAASIVSQGAGDFDCQGHFSTSASAGEILGFYQGQLEARGWNLFSQGAGNGDPQMLFQKAGSDTFYWVIGVTVTRSGSTSNWTYRIYQNSSAI